MERSELEAIKAKKPIYMAKALHQIDRHVSRELRAAYTPSEMEVILRTRPTVDATIILTLVQREDDPTSFDVTRGADKFGSDNITLSEMLSMDGLKQGKLTAHGRSPAAEMIREAQRLVISSPDVAPDIDSIVSKYATSAPEQNPAPTVNTQDEDQHVNRSIARR